MMEPFVLDSRPDEPALFYLRRWMHDHAGLTAGFTSRLGGVSKNHFDSLNCGLHVADEDDDVIANRRLVADTVGMPLESWVYGEQVHGSRVAVIAEHDKGRGTVARVTEIKETDAFVTDVPGISLAAMYADCVPLLFFDPVRQAVGLAHAGWKGSVARIAANTIERMTAVYGSRPTDLLAAIGPSIGPCCYEIDKTLADRVTALIQADGLEGQEGPDHILRQSDGGKYRLDLQGLNRQIMIKAGIDPSNIEVSKLCTSCRTDLLFSHRREQGKTGRMIAWIGLTTDSQLKRGAAEH
jgi:YfiH family protein